MIAVAECEKFAGLASTEMLLGVEPCDRHRVLLSGYLLNLWRGPQRVRRMIIDDMRLSIDLGMRSHAADLLIVLRGFLSDYPEARLELPSRCRSEDIAPSVA